MPKHREHALQPIAKKQVGPLLPVHLSVDRTKGALIRLLSGLDAHKMSAPEVSMATEPCVVLPCGSRHCRCATGTPLEQRQSWFHLCPIPGHKRNQRRCVLGSEGLFCLSVLYRILKYLFFGVQCLSRKTLGAESGNEWLTRGSLLVKSYTPRHVTKNPCLVSDSPAVAFMSATRVFV